MYHRVFKIDGNEYKYTVTESNVCIKKSYLITKRSDMKLAIQQIRETIATLEGIDIKRSDREWLQEWRAHNFLFELNLFRTQTQNVDLNENETKERKKLYRLLSFLYCFRKHK